MTNPPAESIVARFANLLSALRNTYPKQHWGQYLNQHSLPDWSRIVVAGHSSGAGMAALIAKQHKVTRAVLFSSPWDDWHPAGRPRTTADWLSRPSATPLNRWYGEYQAHEDTAGLIHTAFAALKIPPAHQFVFSLDLPPGYRRHHHHNPFHTATTRDIRYAPTWKAMFGQAANVAAAGLAPTGKATP